MGKMYLGGLQRSMNTLLQHGENVHIAELLALGAAAGGKSVRVLGK
jgi:hypothetical protein